ncbi:MAG: RecB family exonuclease [Candidatus Woesearchaeota archaeon]
MKRVQSPSSINTYFQCPRKYYFIYNLKMPTSPSIHLVRGSVAHLVLEKFFTIKPSGIANTYKHDLQIIILELLKKYWAQLLPDFQKLNLDSKALEAYYTETQMMLMNWLHQFIKRVEKLMSEGVEFIDAFTELRPETEVEYRSEQYSVRGFIDAIEKHNDIIRLMDYKTSAKAHITDAYRLQLAIYALLYEEKHGVRPNHVGIYFLNEGEQILKVDDELISHAKFMIEQIHASTEGIDDIKDYVKKESPLCKWSNGQCDFYDYCFNNKPIPSEPIKKK